MELYKYLWNYINIYGIIYLKYGGVVRLAKHRFEIRINILRLSYERGHLGDHLLL